MKLTEVKTSRFKGGSPNASIQPARELVLANASVSTVDSPMTSSIQPTTNGHSKSLEAEAMEIIETVKAEPAEPVAEAVKPKRRARRTAAEIQAEKEPALISVVVDGTQFAGQPDHIARLLNAMKPLIPERLKARSSTSIRVC